MPGDLSGGVDLRRTQRVGILLLVTLAGLGACSSPQPAELSPACRSMLDRQHPGLVDALEQVPGTPAGTTVWIGQDQSSSFVVECASMVSPIRTDYALEVLGDRWPSGGQELQSRTGDVAQIAWFDALPPGAERVTIWRNGSELATVGAPPIASYPGSCPEVSGGVRLVGCGWSDVLEWVIEGPDDVDVDAPLDVVIEGPGDRPVPFRRYRSASDGGDLVLRFGAGKLDTGGYAVRLEDGSELPASTSFEVS